MAAYIEREAAKKLAERYGCTNGAALGIHSGLADCIASEIEALPAADVAPVRHGRWVLVDTDEEQFFICSECENKEYWESDCCPNCGEKMDRGDD